MSFYQIEAQEQSIGWVGLVTLDGEAVMQTMPKRSREAAEDDARAWVQMKRDERAWRAKHPPRSVGGRAARAGRY